MSYNYTNFSIILYCNQKQQKIIYRGSSLKTIEKKYSKLISQEKPLFPVDSKNKKSVDYFIGLVSNHPKNKKISYCKDRFGRNISVNIKENQSLLDLQPYNIEEKIYDNQNKKRILFDDLMEIFNQLSGMKMIYNLNSHLFVENDDTIFFFSLKNIDDCQRLINVLIRQRVKLGLNDCIFSMDVDTIHRKYLYERLKKEGYSIKKLYKHFSN